MKYKLNIPDMIKKEDAPLAALISHWQGKETSDILETFGEIPKDWLEEIKDEPVSAEEWFEKDNKLFNSNNESDWKRLSIYSFKAGEANNELRHRPQQSFDEWWTKPIEGTPRRVAHFDHISREDALQLWQASAKNLNH